MTIQEIIEYIEDRLYYNEETGEYALKATFDKDNLFELYKMLKELENERN